MMTFNEVSSDALMPRLCEVLGVRPGELFRLKHPIDQGDRFRVTDEGHLQISHDRGVSWRPMFNQELLERLINEGVNKAFGLDGSQRYSLTALNNLFGADKIERDSLGLIATCSSDKDVFVRLPKGNCLRELFHDSWAPINILEILKTRKEETNGG